MKSCLGILLVFFTFVTVIGGGALIWYLSNTAEFSKKDASPTAATKPANMIPGTNIPTQSSAPKATVPIPPTTPKARPVR